jgi:ABC-type dipeptide/oligopeptide/nickel transport system permease subunit
MSKRSEKKKMSPMRLALRGLVRNPSAITGFIVLGVIVFIALFANLLIPYDPAKISVPERLQGPSMRHLFGTDQFGRDVLSRIFVGAKYSLLLGLLNTLVSCFMGMIIGSICGFFGAKVDLVVMRLLDVVQSIPGMLLAVVIAAALGPGFWQVIIAIGIAGTPVFARMTRASIMTVRNTEYIEAAELINCSTFRIILKHAMPNAFSPILVQATMSIAMCITLAATISFIGLGVQPPTPEWGAMLAGARDQLREHPYLLIAPGAMIMLSVLSINMIGDALRDVLDPKLRK